MTISHQVFIISDLHLGGDAPNPDDPDEDRRRGFRMMKHPNHLAEFIAELTKRPVAAPSTELVINGDFIDFLAEESTAETWLPFRYEEGAALATFQKVTAANAPDGPIFDRLKAFVEKGHKLTILIGNHDLELSLPEVRDALIQRLGAQANPIRFLLDGEALTFGDAIVEHGNNYDLANAVDHDGLRLLRAIRTRRYFDESMQKATFRPPPGSQLVADLMNPLKRRYGFVDLLKPESEPLFALILLLAPDKKSELKKLVELIPGVTKNAMPTQGIPNFLKNASARPEAPAVATELNDFLNAGLGVDAATKLLADPALNVPLDPVQKASFFGKLKAVGGLFKAWLLGDDALSDDRLDALRQTFRALDEDETWEMSTETGKRYRKAAEELMKGSNTRDGFRLVVFGHTHHAKDVDMGHGRRYINTGTWANLMRFPKLDEDRAKAMIELETFVESVESNTNNGEFMPSYARLDLDADGSVARSELVFYDFANRKIVA